ncbi:GTPase [Azospirillum sp.]|uniref:GTPase n=1 Tax=Azospirillum sp. TaxID=34012 RepID=UPI002D6A1535|nr:GTPase [Azospirillum sp.]HYF87919.1 GTPase [Azospirillum sp.]
MNQLPFGPAPTLDSVLADLIGRALPSLLCTQRMLEDAQRSIEQVDGAIVGTGKADFTESNVAYQLEYRDKPFQLIDVPGIEGNESKYEAMVRAAIARAHLVFYVNGTNKKPEAETAQKIKSYLNRDAVVYALCNIRGKADSYEFPEDRNDLDQTYRDSAGTRAQTQAVLESILGHELVKDCLSVQGLLGFCSVAYGANGLSTISPQRPDLARAQQAYAANFQTPEAMRRFSRIGDIERIIRERAATFESDIVESNKRKVLRLIGETLTALETHLGDHKRLSAEIGREIGRCKAAIEGAFANFRTSISSRCASAVETFFNAVHDSALTAVEEHFDDVVKVNSAIDRHQAAQQKALAERLQQAQSQSMEALSGSVAQALQRLQMDIARARFQAELIKASQSSLSLTEALESIKFNAKDLRSLFTGIGGYAFTGFSLGNLPGAAIGAVVGLVVGVLKYLFSGRRGKIRDAQSRVNSAIQAERASARTYMEGEIASLVQRVRANLDKGVLSALDGELARMNDVEIVLNYQIQSLKSYKAQVEAKSYGEF